MLENKVIATGFKSVFANGNQAASVSPFSCLTIAKPRKLDPKANKITSASYIHPQAQKIFYSLEYVPAPAQ